MKHKCKKCGSENLEQIDGIFGKFKTEEPKELFECEDCGTLNYFLMKREKGEEAMNVVKKVEKFIDIVMEDIDNAISNSDKEVKEFLEKNTILFKVNGIKIVSYAEEK